jgi:hypothetical protein
MCITTHYPIHKAKVQGKGVREDRIKLKHCSDLVRYLTGRERRDAAQVKLSTFIALKIRKGAAGSGLNAGQCNASLAS